MFRSWLDWLLQERHREYWRKVKSEMRRLYTEHPNEAGETFWQHLWFTFTMSMRFLYTGVVIIIHGLFPFLLKREGSRQIEKVYHIMKSRQPKGGHGRQPVDYEI